VAMDPLSAGRRGPNRSQIQQLRGVLSLMGVLFPLGKCAGGWGRRTIADARALFPGATLCRRIVPTGIIEDCTEAACINAGAKRGRHLG
jgi:hypothetical protein